MPYKFTEAGNIVKGAGGQPVYVDDEDPTKEYELNALVTSGKFDELAKESNKRRTKLAEANTRLAAFGDLDPVVAAKAVEDMAGVGDKNKVELDTQRDAINKTWEGKQVEWETEKKRLTDNLFQANVGSKFATSKVVATLVLPHDIAFNTFGKQFNADGSANDAAGNVIYSKENPGTPAKFEEAMGVIIDAYPNKDSILKATAGDGGDGHNSDNGDGGQEGLSSRDNIKAGLKNL